MPARPPLSRRALLGTSVTGLAASVVLTGCDTGDEITPPGATASPSATPERSPASEQSPDEALVDEVTETLLGAIALLASTRKTSGLRAVLSPLLRAHRRHLQVLAPTGERPTAVVFPQDAATALRVVRRGERQLHAVLVGAAGRAESGALARLLASMAASVTQHLAVLPPEPPEAVS